MSQHAVGAGWNLPWRGLFVRIKAVPDYVYFGPVQRKAAAPKVRELLGIRDETASPPEREPLQPNGEAMCQKMGAKMGMEIDQGVAEVRDPVGCPPKAQQQARQVDAHRRKGGDHHESAPRVPCDDGAALLGGGYRPRDPDAGGNEVAAGEALDVRHRGERFSFRRRP